MRESVIYQEIQQEALQRGVEQGLQQGQQQEAAILVLRQLTRRLSQVAPEMRSQIQKLTVEQLEELGEALLDFSSAKDLTDWLENHQG